MAAAAVMLLAGPALGAEDVAKGFGHLSATSNGPAIARGAAMELQVPDQTLTSHPEMYDAAQHVVERFAASRGWRLVASEPLVLRLQIDSTAYNGENPSLPPLATNGSSNTRPPVEVVNRVHIPFEEPPSRGAATYAVHLDLFRPGQPPLWTATVQASAQTTAPNQLITRMTEALIRVFGTNANRDFTLQCDSPDARGTICL
jgi:hypothetical protein